MYGVIAKNLSNYRPRNFVGLKFTTLETNFVELDTAFLLMPSSKSRRIVPLPIELHRGPVQFRRQPHLEFHPS